MPSNEKEKFGIRVGWSNLSSGLHALQLGKTREKKKQHFGMIDWKLNFR